MLTTTELRKKTRGWEGLLAAEGQDLLGEGRRPLPRLADLLGAEADVRARPDRLHQHVGVAEDRGEDVVEIVGDAAGELAHGLDLLRLKMGFLQLAALPQIVDLHQDAEGLPLPVPHQRSRHADRDEIVLPMEAAGVDLISPAAAGTELLELLEHGGAVLRVRDIRKGLGGQLVLGVAEHGAEGLVGVQDVPVQGGQAQPHPGVVENKAEPVLARRQLLGPRGHQLLHLGKGRLLEVDVGAGADPADDVPLLVQLRRATDQMPEIASIGPLDAALDVVILAGDDGFVPGAEAMRQVVGMEEFLPAQPVVPPGGQAGEITPVTVLGFQAAIASARPDDLGDQVGHGQQRLLFRRRLSGRRPRRRTDPGPVLPALRFSSFKVFQEEEGFGEEFGEGRDRGQMLFIQAVGLEGLEVEDGPDLALDQDGHGQHAFSPVQAIAGLDRGIQDEPGLAVPDHFPEEAFSQGNFVSRMQIRPSRSPGGGKPKASLFRIDLEKGSASRDGDQKASLFQNQADHLGQRGTLPNGMQDIADRCQDLFHLRRG